MADNGRQSRIEHNGDEAAGKAVVVQVQSRHRAAGLQHQRRVDEPRQYAAYRAEVAGNGGQRGPKQARQLKCRVIGFVVHTVGPQPHAEHHGDDVPGMLSEGGEAHNGENTAQSGAVEVTPYQQHIGNADQTVDADIHHYRPGAEHTQIIVGRPARGAQQAPVSGPHSPCGIAAAEGADEDKHNAQGAAGKAQFKIEARGPVEHRVRLVTEGRQDRHHHHGEQTAGKAHVVEVHAVLYLIGVGRQGWQQKAHQNTGEHAQRQAGVDAAQCHIAHQRCQRRRQQGHGGILGKRLLLIPGIQPCP